MSCTDIRKCLRDSERALAGFRRVGSTARRRRHARLKVLAPAAWRVRGRDASKPEYGVLLILERFAARQNCAAWENRRPAVKDGDPGHMP